jgi:hypothetical protein
MTARVFLGIEISIREVSMHYDEAAPSDAIFR